MKKLHPVGTFGYGRIGLSAELWAEKKMKFRISLLIITLFLISACGPSSQEKEEIAVLTCNIMGESRNMDAAFRIKEINNAREQIGEERFLGTDEEIKTSFDFNLCKELVLNDKEYEIKLNETRSERIIAEDKAREEKRIAREKEADARRLEREQKQQEEKTRLDNRVKITYGEFVSKTEFIEDGVVVYLCYLEGVKIHEDGYFEGKSEVIATSKDGEVFDDDNREKIKKEYPNCYKEYYESFAQELDLKNKIKLSK